MYVLVSAFDVKVEREDNFLLVQSRAEQIKASSCSTTTKDRTAGTKESETHCILLVVYSYLRKWQQHHKTAGKLGQIAKFERKKGKKIIKHNFL